MKLYYDPASTVCRPIMMFLLEHRLEVEFVNVDLTTGENESDWYTAVNPNRQVPAFEDGDLRLTESATILRFLAAKAGSETYPADLRARATVDEALDWFNTAFYRDFGYGVVYPSILPHYRIHPAQTGEIGAWHEARAARRLAVLDAHMIGGRAWVAGEEISIADYFGGALVTIGEMVGFDFAPYPNVRRWLDALAARPSWAEANAAFYGWRSAVRAQAA